MIRKHVSGVIQKHFEGLPAPSTPNLRYSRTLEVHWAQMPGHKQGRELCPMKAPLFAGAELENPHRGAKDAPLSPGRLAQFGELCLTNLAVRAWRAQ